MEVYIIYLSRPLWMGALTMDDVVNGRITLHGDDARCVYGRVSVTH